MFTVYGRLITSFFDAQAHTSTGHWAQDAAASLYEVV